MFEVLLPVPPTANNLFPTVKKGRRFVRVPSKAYQKWKHEAARALGLQNIIISSPMRGSLVAEYRFSFKDKRRRDIANFEKAVTDYLNDIGVFEDDSQIDRMTLIREPIGNNGVFVTIRELK
jgi:crossover junction endodeoxyribonuclease RusA